MGTGAACKDSHNRNTTSDQAELSHDTRSDPPCFYKQHRLAALATALPLQVYDSRNPSHC